MLMAGQDELRLVSRAGDSRRRTVDRLRAAMARVGRGGTGWDRCIDEAARARQSEMHGDDVPETQEERRDAALADAPVVERSWKIASPVLIGTGSQVLDERLGGGLVHHGVHEFIGDANRPVHAGATMAAAGGTDGWIPYLGPACLLSRRLSSDRRAEGRSAPRTVWIGHRCRPGPWLLSAENHAHTSAESRPGIGTTFTSWFLAPPDTPSGRLWCIEQAIDTESVDLVIADGAGFDAIDTRRLQVAMARRADLERSNILVILCRPAEDGGERSAATTRWDVSALPEGGWHLRLRRHRTPQPVRTSLGAVEGTLGLESSHRWHDRRLRP